MPRWRNCAADPVACQGLNALSPFRHRDLLRIQLGPDLAAEQDGDALSLFSVSNSQG